MDFHSPSTGKCPQCGFHHPPIAQGTICPMAKVKTEGGQEIELNEFLVSIKNIMIANIKKNKIEDVKKFRNAVILNLNQFIESYRG